VRLGLLKAGRTRDRGVDALPDRPRALVLAPLRGPDFEAFQEVVDVIYDPFIDHVPLKLHTEDELASRIARESATILVTEADPAKGSVLDQPLRVIGSTRGDPVNVDISVATAKGIPVLHTPGRNADAVAELAIALLLAAARGLVPGDRDVRTDRIFIDGTIPYQRYRGWELAGRTAGIIGYGAIGRALRWRLEGLGMRVITYDPYSPEATHSDLNQMLAEADVVSVHAAVTPETAGMIGAKQFEAMREGAIYINAARAALHDLDALVGALSSGKLAGAGLDHFQGEHLPVDSPLINLDNVVLTPHIGGATYDTEVNQTRMIVADVLAILRGESPQHCVNSEVLAK
jgi:D-3-phosphoglycerate dehydrogenase / 2-oxoglutarate reductase